MGFQLLPLTRLGETRHADNLLVDMRRLRGALRLHGHRDAHLPRDAQYRDIAVKPFHHLDQRGMRLRQQLLQFFF